MNATRAAIIRALRTAAQVAAASIGSAAVVSAVDWPLVASTTVLAAALSLLTSVATGLPEVPAACVGCDDNGPHGANPELDQ